MKFLDRFFLFAQREEQVTLKDIEDAVNNAHAAKAAHLAAINEAKQTVAAHNQQAQQTIAALSNSIAETQKNINTAYAHLASIEAERKVA